MIWQQHIQYTNTLVELLVIPILSPGQFHFILRWSIIIIIGLLRVFLWILFFWICSGFVVMVRLLWLFIGVGLCKMRIRSGMREMRIWCSWMMLFLYFMRLCCVLLHWVRLYTIMEFVGVVVTMMMAAAHYFNKVQSYSPSHKHHQFMFESFLLVWWLFVSYMLFLSSRVEGVSEHQDVKVDYVRGWTGLTFSIFLPC